MESILSSRQHKSYLSPDDFNIVITDLYDWIDDYLGGIPIDTWPHRITHLPEELVKRFIVNLPMFCSSGNYAWIIVLVKPSELMWTIEFVKTNYVMWTNENMKSIDVYVNQWKHEIH